MAQLSFLKKTWILSFMLWASMPVWAGSGLVPGAWVIGVDGEIGEVLSISGSGDQIDFAPQGIRFLHESRPRKGWKVQTRQATNGIVSGENVLGPDDRVEKVRLTFGNRIAVDKNGDGVLYEARSLEEVHRELPEHLGVKLGDWIRDQKGQMGPVTGVFDGRFRYTPDGDRKKDSAFVDSAKVTSYIDMKSPLSESWKPLRRSCGGILNR